MIDKQTQLKRRKATARCILKLSVPERIQSNPEQAETAQSTIVSALADALTAAYHRQNAPEVQAA